MTDARTIDDIVEDSEGKSADLKHDDNVATNVSFVPSLLCPDYCAAATANVRFREYRITAGSKCDWQLWAEHVDLAPSSAELTSWTGLTGRFEPCADVRILLTSIPVAAAGLACLFDRKRISI